MHHDDIENRSCWRVGIAQYLPTPGDLDGNLQYYHHFTRQAAEQHCDTVLFPELSDTGYQLDLVPSLAQPWPGQSLKDLQAAALEHNVNIIAGLSEREGGLLYNAIAVVDRHGAFCGHYRKNHLFHGPEGIEHEIFEPGREGVTVVLDGCCIGLSLCFDLRFPEFYRHMADNDAVLAVNLAAWPSLRISDWKILCRARAIENQFYLAGVNQCGRTSDLIFGGASCCIAPDGRVVGEADNETCDLLVVDVVREELTRTREAIPLHKSRQTAVQRSR